MFARIFPVVFWVVFPLQLASSLSAKEQAQITTTVPSTCVLSAEQLHSQSDGFVVLDVRTLDQYKAGHTPGSIWVDLAVWTAKAAEPTGLNDQDFWSDQLGRLGVSPEKAIVVVGDALPNSARAWWLLKYCGMPDVRLLDGGYATWLEQKLPRSTELPDLKKTTPSVEFQRARLALLADLQTIADTKSKCNLLDARSQAEYTGSRGVGLRTGHVPHAANLEWTSFVGKDGKLLSTADISQVLKNANVDLDAPTITYCQTGGRSSVLALALEIAGAEQVKNYYFGWSEYASALALPVEK